MNQSTINRKIREIRRLLDELAAEVENTPEEPKAPQIKTLARMRTIPEAVREIKEADPPDLHERVKAAPLGERGQNLHDGSRQNPPCQYGGAGGLFERRRMMWNNLGLTDTKMTIVQYQPERDDEPYTTSEIIAERANVAHHAIQQLVTKYEADFYEFGIIAFEMRKIGGRGRPKTIYHLNEQQATLLLTYLKNTPTVRAFKKELVRQFYEMRAILWEQQHPSIEGMTRRMMTDEKSYRAGFAELTDQMAQATRKMFFNG